MHTATPDLVRTQVSARLDEAAQRRRGTRLVRAGRLSRRAERAAQQASAALARAF